MAADLDAVERYAQSLGVTVRRRTVLVEGTTDARLFDHAARLEKQETGRDLLGGDLAVVAAGEGDKGGTGGVVRELVSLRAVARTELLPNGKPKYRIVGLVDNDNAGKRAVTEVQRIDAGIMEFKDIFRLWPVWPAPKDLSPPVLRSKTETENESYKRLDWELEDLFSASFVDAFLEERPGAVARKSEINGRVHRDFTVDGKARFHHFIKLHAMHKDLAEVIRVLEAMRFYLGLT